MTKGLHNTESVPRDIYQGTYYMQSPTPLVLDSFTQMSELLVYSVLGEGQVGTPHITGSFCH